MIQSIAFTAYPMRDMARSRDFYERVLGLRLSYDHKNERVEYDIGGGTFAITTMETGQKPGTRGGEVGFEVADLDSVVSRLKSKSVTFIMDIFETPVCRMAVIEDPDKNHIVLHKLKG